MNIATAFKVAKSAKRVIFRLALNSDCFRDFDFPTIGATVHLSLSEMSKAELQKSFNQYLLGERSWGFLKERLPLLEELILAFVHDSSSKGLRYYLGGNEVIDIAIANITRAFEEGKKEGWMRKDLVVSFMDRSAN